MTPSQNNLDSTKQTENALDEGLDKLGLALSVAARSSLLAYCQLLSKWNRTYNLTSITSAGEMVSHHLLDSLAVLPHLPVGRVIDVGTGPGLPGIPLAIARPGQSFTLLDSNGKKTRFLVQAVGELGLANVEVVNSRVEDYRPTELFDVVISRAFASLANMVNACAHLLAANGVFLAMKGKYPQAEIAEIPAGFQLLGTTELEVPGLGAQRHLLMLGRS